MAEIRLNKLIKQFNIGLDMLVDFLNSKGAGIEHANPNMKVSDEYLPELHKKFGKDLELKEAAEKVDAKLTEILDKASRRTVGISDQDQRATVKKPASVAPEEFDWDAFKSESVAGENREEVAALYDHALAKIVENEVVEGVITSINRREVTVNIGSRCEGVISSTEFRYNPDLKVGDKVEVLVESAADRKGLLVISHKKARQLKSWDMVTKAYDSGEIVKGYIKTRTKGGMIVDIFGIEAFLPVLRLTPSRSGISMPLWTPPWISRSSRSTKSSAMSSSLIRLFLKFQRKIQRIEKPILRQNERSSMI